MANLNKVFLMGNLTRDPELRYTPSGTAVCDFGMAMNRKYKDKDETTFIDVVAWARTAEVICEYLKKGRPIFVEGRLTYDSWEDREGQKRSRIRVTCDNFQFIGGRGEGGQQGGGQQGGGSQGGGSRGGQRPQRREQAPPPSDGPPAEGDYQIDDDIPF